MTRSLWFGVSGGLLAGTGVGLCEAVWVLSQTPTGEYFALLDAALLYGGAGAIVGCLAGALLALIGLAFPAAPRLPDPLGFTMSGLAVTVSVGSWVLVHQVNRSVYLELGLGMAGRVAVGLLMLVVVILGLWLGPIFLTRTPLKILLKARGTVAAWAAVVLLAAVFALSPGPSAVDVPIAPVRSTQPDLGDTPDVVLISVESLRADVLPDGMGGDGSVVDLPGFSRLMEDGLTFTQHIATSSWRRPSLASMMTAQLPAGNGVDVVAARLGADRLTLAEVLQGRGYVTADLPARAELETALGFSQGFDWLLSYGERHDTGPAESVRHLLLPTVLRRRLRAARGGPVRPDELHRSADEVMAAARRFIGANRQMGNRYMAWIHLAEPSLPYVAEDGRAVVQHRSPTDMDAEGRDKARQAYGAEVRVVDRVVRELMDWLDQQGALEDAMVVLVGTQGEELFEHGGWGHGDTVYDEQLRTPLVMKLPGGALAGRKVPWQVSTIDIAPTILAVTGTAQPEPWEGQSLLDQDTLDWLADPESSQPDARPAVAQLHRHGVVMEAYRRPPWKLVRARSGGARGVPVRAIFNLESDPGERVNLAGQTGAREPQLSRQLRERLARSMSWRTLPAVARP